jgi:hypothetical protein
MTMKKLNFMIIALVVAFMAASCGGNSIDSALNQVEKAIDKVEKNKTSMTAADWKAFNEEMDAPCKVLNEALESEEVGALKKIKISAVVLRMAAVAGEAALHTVVDSLNLKMRPALDSLNLQLQQTGVTDSIVKTTDILQSDEAKQAAKELQQAVDELKNILK